MEGTTIFLAIIIHSKIFSMEKSFSNYMELE